MEEKNRTEKSLESYRDEFPITKNHIYFDHAGVAPVSLRVKSAVNSFIEQAAGAAVFGYESWMERVEEVRASCARLIGALPGEIAFVKNTSHGISIVAEGIDWKKRDNVLVYRKEFPANIYPWMNLRRKGVELRFIPDRDGQILTRDIEELIDSRTRLLSLSSVQFSTGFRSDLETIGNICKSRDVLFFVDAIQSLGAAEMDVKRLGFDFLAADGHKWLMAPEGTGIFYCRKDMAESITPPLIGWKSIVNEEDYDHLDFRLKPDALRFEEGSLNVLGIYALGAAVELLLEVGIERIEEKVLSLGDLIIEEAEKRGIRMRSPADRNKRAGINIFTGNFDPAYVQQELEKRGILVRVRGGAIRCAPHFYNTEDQILELFETIDNIVNVSSG